MRSRLLPAFLAPLALAAVVSTPPAPDPAARASVAEALVPEPLLSPHGVVVSSSELAARAGARILEAGGNAVDAAVAAAFMLSAADPSESGIGGEAWLLYRPAAGPAVAVLCPSRVPRRIDVAALKHAMEVAGPGGHVTAAAPTAVATLTYALARFGTKGLAEVLAPAIEEAERGWTVGWYEASLYVSNARKLNFSTVLGPVLYPGPCGPDGWPAPVRAGHRLRLDALAGTLRRVAAGGAFEFYRGRTAAAIEADMREHGGFVRKDDLARVPSLVVETEPLRVVYRDREILTVGAPAGGGALAEVMQILSEFPPKVVRGPSADATQLLLDAVRIARQDERLAEGTVRASGPFRPPFLERSHTERRAAEIRLGTAWNAKALRAPEPPPARTGGTTQVSVADARGNVVALTQTLGDDWGSGAASAGLGFPYNAALRGLHLDDPDDPSYPRAEAVLSAQVTPTIVLRDGAVEMVLGSGGSSRIVPAVASVLRNVIDGGMSLPDAVSFPRVLWQDEVDAHRLIAERSAPVTGALLEELKKRGYVEQYVVADPAPALVSFGGVNLAGWSAAARAWEGVGDPRRRGVAAVPESVAPAPR